MRTFTLIALSLAALPALAQDGLQRCRAIADATARLTCYDALAAAPKPPAVPVAAAVPAAPVAATKPAPKPADNFGLPASKRPDEAQEVQSSVGPSFDGWGPNSRIRLDNGQVWQVTDGTSTSIPERARKVAVKRGALGSFYLDIEGLNTSPRVRRVE